MKTVLLITSLCEKYYYEAFLKASEGREVTIYLFLVDEFPVNSSLWFELSEGKISGETTAYKYLNGNLNKEIINIDEIDIAWYLRPQKPVPLNAQSELEARFTLNESKAALDMLYSALRCRWIARKEIVSFLEENKFYQQMIAHECGLVVPQTLVSNDSHRVIAFSSNEEKLVLKTLGFTELSEKGNLFIYSQLFDKKEMENRAQGISSCPVFCQKYIPKKFEYRVMVIGKKVLACRIDSQASEKTKHDWRHYDFDKVAHLQVDLPSEVCGKLLAFMRKIDLQYGAIDLIETPSNDFVFLEINPSGQWEWIHVLAGLDIPTAVVDMFVT